jgi:UPF0755 protein
VSELDAGRRGGGASGGGGEPRDALDDLDALRASGGVATATMLPEGEREGRRVRRLESSRRRRIWILVVLLVGAPLVVAGAATTWVWWELDPPGAPGAEVELEVADGWGTQQIGDELARQGVVGSSLVFTTYARLTGRDEIQAGTYVLRRDLGARAALDALEAGPVIVYQDVAVPPGHWISEVAQMVEAQLPGRTAERFLTAAASGAVRSKYQPEGTTSLEGFLWPDTYRFTADDDEVTVLQTMVGEFDRRADALGLVTASVEGLSPYQVLTVASMIQQEAKLDEDRPLIASVIYNRLRQSMALQIDASVIYGVGQATGVRPAVGLTEQQLATDTPWNTYTRQGLPATPISSVTEASIAAALQPATTSYLYYVLADADGGHSFAETYEEHLANVAAARAQGLLG